MKLTSGVVNQTEAARDGSARLMELTYVLIWARIDRRVSDESEDLS